MNRDLPFPLPAMMQGSVQLGDQSGTQGKLVVAAAVAAVAVEEWSAQAASGAVVFLHLSPPQRRKKLPGVMTAEDGR